MGTRAPQTNSPSASAPQQNNRRLRKGELLFAEGENSRAMYFVKSGMIRIFKKKGESHIEIDTIHSGQVLGELAFLDGNPRSASAEALTECELIEVSGPTFQSVLNKMPDWLKILLKTVVGRLRTASTRIRQLESASTAFDYSNKDGKRTSHYVYLAPTDVLKIASGLLLVGARNGTVSGLTGTEIRVGLLQRYCNQIMGVPTAKITTLLDVLEQCDVVTTTHDVNGTKVILNDIDFLEQAITYLNEENLLEPNKRHDISIRGFLIMGFIVKHLSRFNKDKDTGLTSINLAEILQLEKGEDGKDPFRMEEFPELVGLGYAKSLSIKNNSEIYSQINANDFIRNYRLQRISIALQAVNEQKRKAGGMAK